MRAGFTRALSTGITVTKIVGQCCIRKTCCKFDRDKFWWQAMKEFLACWQIWKPKRRRSYTPSCTLWLVSGCPESDGKALHVLWEGRSVFEKQKCSRAQSPVGLVQIHTNNPVGMIKCRLFVTHTVQAALLIFSMEFWTEAYFQWTYVCWIFTCWVWWE